MSWQLTPSSFNLVPDFSSILNEAKLNPSREYVLAVITPQTSFVGYHKITIYLQTAQNTDKTIFFYILSCPNFGQRTFSHLH